MSIHRLFVAYLGLLIVACAVGALLGASAGRDARAAAMELHP